MPTHLCRHAFGPATITPYGYRALEYAVVNNLFTERLRALVYTERLIYGNFGVWSPVNGRKSGVNGFGRQKIVYLAKIGIWPFTWTFALIDTSASC